MADNNAGDGVDNVHLITPLLVRGPTHFPRQQNPLTSRHIGLSPPTEYCLSWFFSLLRYYSHYYSLKLFLKN